MKFFAARPAAEGQARHRKERDEVPGTTQMDTKSHDTTAPSLPLTGGLRPARGSDAHREGGSDGAMRGATMTLVIALYPLVGSVTVVIAALLLAGGALAG